ncbi:MAG: hypothetical protein RL572_2103 [Pseudomonadota bacterium]
MDAPVFQIGTTRRRRIKSIRDAFVASVKLLIKIASVHMTLPCFLNFLSSFAVVSCHALQATLYETLIHSEPLASTTR